MSTLSDIEAAYAALSSAFEAEKAKLLSAIATTTEAQALAAIQSKIKGEVAPVVAAAQADYSKLLTAVKTDWSKLKTWWDSGWRWAVISASVGMVYYGFHSGLIKF